MNHPKIQLRPTGQWFLFGPILGCMWLAAVNYSNNLIYAILYLVGALTFVSIFHTWRNLASLEVEHVRVHSAFAGSEARVEIHFRNTTSHPVYGLFFARLEGRSVSPLATPDRAVMRIDVGDTRTADLFFPVNRRGRYRFGTLLVRSSYPFGLICANLRLPVNADYFIYPEPRGAALFPELVSATQIGLLSGRQSGDDFAGVRAYSPGESLRHVDWKAYARGRPLSIKQFGGDEGRELWFDFADIAGSGEDRLSQLARWVTTAEKENIPYALRLKEAILPLGLGAGQARQALEMLATSRNP